MSALPEAAGSRSDGERVETATASKAPPLVLLMGNPNVGKTSLFNRLAGRRERVGNYPGVTVERRAALVQGPGGPFDLVDVPGAYSLSARSADEEIALQAALGWSGQSRPALVVVVVDAGQALRNLYLCLQLLEFGLPVVVALNMVDEAGQRAPEPQQIAEGLGVYCVPTNGRTGKGAEALLDAIGQALQRPKRTRVHVNYPDALQAEMDSVAESFPRSMRRSVEHDRALGLWALSSVDADDELLGVPPEVRRKVLALRAGAQDRDWDGEIVGARYRFLESNVLEEPQDRPASAAEQFTERMDRVLLHPVLGLLLFLATMLVVFQALFSWADPAIGLVEAGVAGVASLAKDWLPPGLIADLVTEGVIGGVGNVVVFLPQILLLFFFVGLLEDSGYMARVAYLMDRALRGVGLHGRAFVPMMSGFACAVPAILATRTMERQRDRLLTMLVVPLMSCSARLPVYTLVIAALFPASMEFGGVPVQGLLMVAMYAMSTAVALLAAAVLGKTVVRGASVPLILELPPYRLPGLRAVVRAMLGRGRVFLVEAGTTILVFTLVMWGLLNFPRPAEEPQLGLQAASPAAAEARPAPAGASRAALRSSTVSRQVRESYAGQLGRALEPALEPLGFDWKIGVGIIGAFAAREVFVSTLGMVFGVDAEEDDAPLRQRLSEARDEFGKPAYSPLAGLSLLVFFALACQCMSTLAVVKRETGGFKWPAFLFLYMTALAWLSSFAVYQVGSLILAS